MNNTDIISVLIGLQTFFIIRLFVLFEMREKAIKSFQIGMFKWMEMQEKMNPERFNAELHKVLEELKGENK